MKKVTDLGPKDAIHCKTEDDNSKIKKLLHDSGLKLKSGKSYIMLDNWDYYKQLTVYFPYDGLYGNVEVDARGKNIHLASDFIENEQ